METEMRLVEKVTQNNIEEIKDLKKRMDRMEEDVQSLKINQTVTSQSVTSIQNLLSELKGDIRSLDDKFNRNNEEQLKSYKKMVWQVAGTIIAAVFLIVLGLN